MSCLQEYYKAIERYRNGEFGKEHLSIDEILHKSGKPDLLKGLTVTEVQHLIETSSGMTKSMFCELKQRNEKMKKLLNVVPSKN